MNSFFVLVQTLILMKKVDVTIYCKSKIISIFFGAVS